MTEKYNPTKDFRFRKRSGSTVSPDWEVLQAVVGFAFTIQQEYLRLRRDTNAMLSAIAQQQAASVETGYPAALQRIVASAHNLTEASGAAIALGNEQGMICVARSGACSPPLGSRFDGRSGLSGECIRSRESVMCMNAAADPRVDYGACTALGIKSMVYRPLLAKGKLIGVLAVFSSRPQHFSHRDLKCLKWTDELISDAIDRHESQVGVGLLIRDALGPEVALPIEASPNLPGVAAEPAKKTSPNALTPKTIEAPLMEPKLLNGGNATIGMLDVSEKAAPPKPAVAVAPAKPSVIKEAAPPRPAPTFVGRVVDESVASDELPSFDRKEEPYESPIPMLVAAIMVLAFLVVVGLTSYLKLGSKGTTARATPTIEQQQPPNISASPAAAESEPAKAPTTEAQPPAVNEEPSPAIKLGSELPGNMEFRSEPGKSTLNILLDHAITYQGFAIKSPDRLYFDVNGINLVGSKGASVAVQSPLVSRIRIWQRNETTARIVFDLHQAVDYYAVQSVNPQRLSIELHPKAASKSIPVPEIAPATESASTAAVTIVIDPGHGGHDNGAISATGLQEKDLTLDLAQRLGSLLEKRLGAKVVYTRTKDEFVSLADRVTIANNSRADLMISIHGNSSTYRSVRGLETYYFKNSQEALSLAANAAEVRQSDSDDAARSFAADVHRALLHGLSDGDETRNRGLKTAPFVVLRDAHMPAVLAEVAFISSRKDAKRLETASFRDKVAKALYQGISNHVSRRDARILAASDLHSTTTVAAR